MSEEPARVERDRQMIQEAAARGTGPKFWAYTKLSGPGWLQSAITLGGGSLAGSLYLGVLAGYSLMWLQPLAMILAASGLSGLVACDAASSGDAGDAAPPPEAAPARAALSGNTNAPGGGRSDLDFFREMCLVADGS